MMSFRKAIPTLAASQYVQKLKEQIGKISLRSSDPEYWSNNVAIVLQWNLTQRKFQVSCTTIRLYSAQKVSSSNSSAYNSRYICITYK